MKSATFISFHLTTRPSIFTCRMVQFCVPDYRISYFFQWAFVQHELHGREVKWLHCVQRDEVNKHEGLGWHVSMNWAFLTGVDAHLQSRKFQLHHLNLNNEKTSEKSNWKQFSKNCGIDYEENFVKNRFGVDKYRRLLYICYNVNFKKLDQIYI